MVPLRPSQGFSLPPKPPKRRRRQRTVYSVEQKEELERSFQNNHYLSYEEREMLAARLNLQEQQVQVWFKNRRAKQTRLKRGTGTRQRGLTSQASSQGPGVCTSVPAPAAAGPRFREDQISASGPGFAGEPELPWDLLLSEDPMVSGGPVLLGGTGFHDPFGGIAAAESNASSHLQAGQDPRQDAQNMVPVAPAAAPAPASGPVRPEEWNAGGFWPDLDLVNLLSM